MSEKYFSIAEFAEKANVSPQSVYQRIKRENDEIHKYIKISKDGKKVIAETAIDIIYNKNINGNYEEIEETEKQTQDNIIIDILQNQVKQLTAEIEFKNKQIEELQTQLKASSERETNYQHLLNQQQTLNGMDKQKILLLENETTKKKKGFFGIFKKKDKENKVNGEGE